MNARSPDFEHYGIDEGPIPEIETVNHVEVPISELQLSASEVGLLVNEVDPLESDSDFGVTIYQMAKNSSQYHCL